MTCLFCPHSTVLLHTSNKLQDLCVKPKQNAIQNCYVLVSSLEIDCIARTILISQRQARSTLDTPNLDAIIHHTYRKVEACCLHRLIEKDTRCTRILMQ